MCIFACAVHTVYHQPDVELHPNTFTIYIRTKKKKYFVFRECLHQSATNYMAMGSGNWKVRRSDKSNEETFSIDRSVIYTFYIYREIYRKNMLEQIVFHIDFRSLFGIHAADMLYVLPLYYLLAVGWLLPG